MTQPNQSELEKILPCDCGFMKGFAYKPGGPCGGTCWSAPYRKAIQAYINANYTPINQPSTNTAPVIDDNPDKPSTNELYRMLIDHMQNMLTNPQPVDVDYGAHLLDRLLGECEQEAYKRGYKARQAPEVENTI